MLQSITITAGAGKTFALATAREGWEASGHQVIGAALAARAAQQLEEGSGIPSATIDRLLARLDRSGASALTAGHVVVVDECSMVGTRKLLRLLEHAERAGAKVVLVGDPRQLPEIEAGGAFGGLVRRLDGSALTDNRRQQEPWERAALAELRTGDTDRALDTYRSHGRVHEAPNADHAMGRLVDDWLAARQLGEHPLMLAGRRSEVEELNRRARGLLQEEGKIGPDLLGYRHQRFGVGDEVLALHNDYRLGLINGTRGTITAIDRDLNEIVVAVGDDRSLAVPFDYIASAHLTHSYAMTIHKAQGATADRALLLADDTLSREHAYTGLSRGVVRNDLYLVVDDHRAEVRHAPEVTREPDEAVRAAVRRSGAKTMAIDEVPEDRALPSAASVDDQREELRGVRQRLQRVEGLLDDAVARRDAAHESLDHLPISTLGTRRREKELLAVAERDIATIIPVRDGLRTRCSNLEQAPRHQPASSERTGLGEELSANLEVLGPFDDRLANRQRRSGGEDGIDLW